MNQGITPSHENNETLPNWTPLRTRQYVQLRGFWVNEVIYIGDLCPQAMFGIERIKKIGVQFSGVLLFDHNLKLKIKDYSWNTMVTCCYFRMSLIRTVSLLY